MVEGTGLENQRRKRPQVRILSFPPNLFREVKSPVAIRASWSLYVLGICKGAIIFDKNICCFVYRR